MRDPGGSLRSGTCYPSLSHQSEGGLLPGAGEGRARRGCEGQKEWRELGHRLKVTGAEKPKRNRKERGEAERSRQRARMTCAYTGVTVRSRERTRPGGRTLLFTLGRLLHCSEPRFVGLYNGTDGVPCSVRVAGHVEARVSSRSRRARVHVFVCDLGAASSDSTSHSDSCWRVTKRT